MSSEKLETISSYVSWRHYWGTVNVDSDGIAKNSQKILVGKCIKCNRNESRSVSDNTFKAEILGHFLNN